MSVSATGKSRIRCKSRSKVGTNRSPLQERQVLSVACVDVNIFGMREACACINVNIFGMHGAIFSG